MNIVYSREWLSIANRALNLIGEESLQDFNGTSNATQDVLVQLPSAVQRVLSEYPYRSCRKRTSIAPLIDGPAFGYSFQYQLPADFISLVEVNGAAAESNDYSLEGGCILSNESSMNIIYEAFPETPQNLPAMLQELITLMLAHDLVSSVTTNDNKAVILYQQYEALKSQAIRMDDRGHHQDNGKPWWTEER